jgi:hypothetical protein
LRDLRGAAVVVGKQENFIRKLPPRCIIGKPTIGHEGHQHRPSDVKRFEQAVKRSGQPHGRYVLMIVQTLSLLQQLLFVRRYSRFKVRLIVLHHHSDISGATAALI